MKDLNHLLKSLYPKSYDHLLKKLSEIMGKGSNNEESKSDWYKNMNLYVTYPDAFCEDGQCDLNVLKDKVSYISDLGCNALHILPFLESPMIDKGFDISDYKSVREDIGGDKAFDNLLKQCRKNNIRVFVDIVLNHLSVEHEWFKKAVGGSEYHRKLFYSTKKKPNLIKIYKDESAVWGRYLINGKEENIRIIFPDHVGEIPHWVRAEDGYWYYHTFYPHQIDINWNNPDVFLEFVKILKYWAEKGLSFRLDAIPYMGKNLYEGIVDDKEMIHNIVLALNKIVKAVSKDSVFLAEACLQMDEIKRYFGREDVEAELAYNFDLMKGVWNTVLTKDSSYLWKVLDESYEDIPDWASWITFLRNHDELTLEMTDPELRKSIHGKLVEKGADFRQGFGIAGRTASFLHGDKRRIVNAYFLLASLPGCPAIIYGDEIGKLNDIQYMKQQTEAKVKRLGEEISDDTRDMNRGKIWLKDIENEKSKKIYNSLSDIFNMRKKMEFSDEKPERIETKESVVAGKYRKFRFYINLTDEEIELDESFNKILLSINDLNCDKKLKLGAFAGMWVK